MKVVKKLGYREDFNLNKIRLSLQKTAKRVGAKFTNENWHELKPRIKTRLDSLMEDKEEIYFWEIDDCVVDSLLRSRFNDLTVGYIEGRKHYPSDTLNDLNLSPIAMYLLKKRYLRTDAEGNYLESAKEMMCRVGTAVASAEESQELREYYTKEFSDMLCNLEFLPNSPCLVSAGSDRDGTLAACFAYNIDDSLDSIFETLKTTAKTFQMGGGVGITLSNLREQGCLINTSNGKSSGPVNFMYLFDSMVETVKAGGFRRGALMSMMKYNHPDIEKFIHCKKNTEVLNNMNISVLATDEFIDSYKKGKDVPLVSPHNNKIKRTVSANHLMDIIATNIWETGEPGVLFYNRMNRDNPTPHLGDLDIVNPCSESNLLSNESCNLGSINLVKHIDNGDIDWEKLANTTHKAIRFLDNMITISPYPNKEVEERVKSTRKIGLGVMGFADLLIKLNIKYSSNEAVDMAEKIMGFIQDVADQESKELGKEKGYYEAYKKGYVKRRNSIVTTQAPTGSLSLIAGVSPGIEPNFSKGYTRELDGNIIRVSHPLADYDAFETTYDIPPKQHLEILAAFQKHVENSISKTINIPESTTVEEVKEIILDAYDKDVKGITIFRDNCSREELIKCEDCRLPEEDETE